jgi:hypothetical protein
VEEKPVFLLGRSRAKRFAGKQQISLLTCLSPLKLVLQNTINWDATNSRNLLARKSKIRLGLFLKDSHLCKTLTSRGRKDNRLIRALIPGREHCPHSHPHPLTSGVRIPTQELQIGEVSIFETNK